MQLAKYWRIKIQGCCWPRCRDTWKPFRRFRCSKRWSWLKAALFNFAMWGCGADLQSSVIWSYPRSTIPHSSTPSPSRHGTQAFHIVTIFSFIQTYLYFLSYLLSLMPRESKITVHILKCQISSEEIQNWIHLIIHHLLMDGYTMSVSWAAKSMTPALASRSKWRIPVQNCLIILLSSPPLAARLFKASPGGKILPFCAFVRSVGTWQQLNNQKCT